MFGKVCCQSVNINLHPLLPTLVANDFAGYKICFSISALLLHTVQVFHPKSSGSVLFSFSWDCVLVCMARVTGDGIHPSSV